MTRRASPMNRRASGPGPGPLKGNGRQGPLRGNPVQQVPLRGNGREGVPIMPSITPLPFGNQFFGAPSTADTLAPGIANAWGQQTHDAILAN